MRKNILSAISFAFLLSSSVFSAGCSSDSNTGNASNANRIAPVVNASVSPTMTSSTPAANAAANSANSMSAVNSGKNNQTATPVKESTPIVSPGANDFAMFTQIRAAISASDPSILNALVVDVKNGNVVLSGKVSSDAQKTKAAQLAQSVKDVKSVKNNIQVAP